MKLKDKLFFIVVVLMIAGLFVSRAVLSIASILVLVFFFIDDKDKHWKTILAGTLLIILPAFVSGLWSDNRTDWWRSVEVKLPLLTIGLGLSFATIKARAWRWILRIVLLFTVAGTMWSIVQFFNNAQTITEGYLKAKVLPTPFDEDHIRFSWFVDLCILSSLYLVKNCRQRWEIVVTTAAIIWLIVYLHILAAKTGLICLYIGAFILLFDYVITRRKFVLGFMALAVLIVLPVAAYFAIPTLKNRVQYVIYDFSNYSRGRFLPGSSDGARVLSLKAGLEITRSHVLTGVGFGDIKSSVNEWHTLHHPTTIQEQRFIPLNEWLIYSSGAGIVGMLLFSWGILLILSLLWKNANIIDKTIAIVLIVPLITDDTLESQFGVFIFIFMVMWLRLRKTLIESPVV